MHIFSLHFLTPGLLGPCSGGGTEIQSGAVLSIVSAGFSGEVEARTNVSLSKSRKRPSGLGSTVLVALGSHG